MSVLKLSISSAKTFLAQVSLTSKSSQAKAGARPPGGPAMPPRSRSEGGGPGARAGGQGILRGAGGQKENRGGARDLEGLDQELMAMKVDPGLLHRTVETSRRQHVRRERSLQSPAPSLISPSSPLDSPSPSPSPSPPSQLLYPRSASPMERDRSPLGGRRQGFADRCWCTVVVLVHRGGTGCGGAGAGFWCWCCKVLRLVLCFYDDQT